MVKTQRYHDEQEPQCLSNHNQAPGTQFVEMQIEKADEQKKKLATEPFSQGGGQYDTGSQGSKTMGTHCPSKKAIVEGILQGGNKRKSRTCRTQWVMTIT